LCRRGEEIGRADQSAYRAVVVFNHHNCGTAEAMITESGHAGGNLGFGEVLETMVYGRDDLRLARKTVYH
jgi:hypothetical protein